MGQRDFGAAERGALSFLQVVAAIELGEFGALDQAVEERGDFGAADGARAVVVLAAEHDATQRPLGAVVVRLT